MIILYVLSHGLILWCIDCAWPRMISWPYTNSPSVRLELTICRVAMTMHALALLLELLDKTNCNDWPAVRAAHRTALHAIEHGHIDPTDAAKLRSIKDDELRQPHRHTQTSPKVNTVVLDNLTPLPTQATTAPPHPCLHARRLPHCPIRAQPPDHA